MVEVRTIVDERKRGCGFRKQGGTYFVSDATELKGCGKLPLPLDVCPCCGQGVKPSRGWTWVNGKVLFADKPCSHISPLDVGGKCICILADPPEKLGLLWVGEKFYATPADFLKEGAAQGFSRRISAIPKDFVLGDTWIMFAHRKAIGGQKECETCKGTGVYSWVGPDANLNDIPMSKPCDDCNGTGKIDDSKPGIFFMFRPERIEYIVRDDDTEEDLERKVKRGISLVKLVRTDDEKTDEPEGLFEDDGQPSEQQEQADFAHDTDEFNRDGSEVL